MVRPSTQWLLALFTSLELLLIGCTPQFPPMSNPTPMPTIPSSGQTLPITAEITIANQHKFQLEVAQTPQEQATGLMYRPALPNDRGMIFPMSPARPVQFWMKNVPVALDMVFIYQGKILAIGSQIPPCTTPECPNYGPRGNVDHVLELRAGRAAELGLKPGDSAIITTLNSKP